MKVWTASSHSTSVDVLLRAEMTGSDDVRGRIRALYAEHAKGLYVTLRRLTWAGCDVDALLHDVFVVALRRADAVLRAESPKAWLYGVALSLAASSGRKHRLRELLGLKAAPVGAPVTDPDARERTDLVHRALGKLSPKKREVLVLFELQGFSGPEIAQTLGCSLQTVWTRLHYARHDFEQVVRDE